MGKRRGRERRTHLDPSEGLSDGSALARLLLEGTGDGSELVEEDTVEHRHCSEGEVEGQARQHDEGEEGGEKGRRGSKNWNAPSSTISTLHLAHFAFAFLFFLIFATNCSAVPWPNPIDANE